MVQTDLMDFFNQAKNVFDIIFGEKKLNVKLLMKKSIHYNYYVQLVE